MHGPIFGCGRASKTWPSQELGGWGRTAAIHRDGSGTLVRSAHQ